MPAADEISLFCGANAEANSHFGGQTNVFFLKLKNDNLESQAASPGFSGMIFELFGALPRKSNAS